MLLAIGSVSLPTTSAVLVTVPVAASAGTDTVTVKLWESLRASSSKSQVKPGSGRITVIGRVARNRKTRRSGKESVTVPPPESEGPLLVTSQEIYVVGLAGGGAAAIVALGDCQICRQTHRRWFFGDIIFHRVSLVAYDLGRVGYRPGGRIGRHGHRHRETLGIVKSQFFKVTGEARQRPDHSNWSGRSES